VVFILELRERRVGRRCSRDSALLPGARLFVAPRPLPSSWWRMPASGILARRVAMTKRRDRVVRVGATAQRQEGPRLAEARMLLRVLLRTRIDDDVHDLHERRLDAPPRDELVINKTQPPRVRAVLH
jgi:hypothetical protein